MAHLLSIADNVIKLNAICVKCGKIASFSQWFLNNKINDQILVGESDKYEARCRNSHKP